MNKLPKAEVVRSVYVVSNNEIYTGGYEEFGKWSRQPDGELTYTSLSKELPTDNWQNDDIWRILPQGESIYFNHSAASSATTCRQENRENNQTGEFSFPNASRQ